LTKEEKEVESTVEICRAYLRSIIICALDTAMRKGEIQSLQWKEVFLTEKYIFIDGEKTKTGVDGLAPVTPRLADELEKLKSQFPHEPEDHVFPFGDFKKAFDNAAADAGIENLQFRDLRSTASTRMLLAGNTGELVRKITRHTQVKTFHDHYTNIDIQNARLIGEKLADFTSGQISKGNDKENMKKAASGEAA
ncbi:MAG TPA: site-specific integrase, partial [Pyrinomonadaceae bacterium]